MPCEEHRGCEDESLGSPVSTFLTVGVSDVPVEPLMTPDIHTSLMVFRKNLLVR